MRVISTMLKAAKAAAVKAALEAVEQEVGRLVEFAPVSDADFDAQANQFAQSAPYMQAPTWFHAAPKPVLSGTRGERVYAAALLGARAELQQAELHIGQPMPRRPSFLETVHMTVMAYAQGQRQRKVKNLIHGPDGMGDPDEDPRGGVFS